MIFVGLFILGTLLWCFGTTFSWDASQSLLSPFNTWHYQAGNVLQEWYDDWDTSHCTTVQARLFTYQQANVHGNVLQEYNNVTLWRITTWYQE
jgi:hypothetical protein